MTHKAIATMPIRAKKVKKKTNNLPKNPLSLFSMSFAVFEQKLLFFLRQTGIAIF